MAMTVKLTQGKLARYSIRDHPVIKNHKWFAVKSGNVFYAATKINGNRVMMHRLILGVTDCLVDHIDGDGLNNVRSNIRRADHTINMRNRALNSNNSSGIAGVHFRKNHGPEGAWVSIGIVDGIFRSVSFSCMKYGAENAKSLAIQHRKDHEATYSITVRSRRAQP